LYIWMKVGEFSKRVVDIAELEQVYGLQNMPVPPDRPYVWTNTVMSIDGVMNTYEIPAEGPTIVLQKGKNPDSESDWRVLNYGWAITDAVLYSSQGLRDEPEFVMDVCYEDLMKYRVEVLKKSPQPTKVILTSTVLKFDHKVWISGGEKIVLTTKKNCEAILKENPGCEEFLKKNNASVVGIDAEGRLTPSQIVTYLRKEKNILHMEISAGPNVMAQFLEYGLVDETRFTQTGTLFGHISSAGVPRPYFGQHSQFNAHNFPFFDYQYIRLFGNYLFIRGKWRYQKPT